MISILRIISIILLLSYWGTAMGGHGGESFHDDLGNPNCLEIKGVPDVPSAWGELVTSLAGSAYSACQGLIFPKSDETGVLQDVAIRINEITAPFLKLVVLTILSESLEDRSLTPTYYPLAVRKAYLKEKANEGVIYKWAKRVAKDILDRLEFQNELRSEFSKQVQGSLDCLLKGLDRNAFQREIRASEVLDELKEKERKKKALAEEKKREEIQKRFEEHMTSSSILEEDKKILRYFYERAMSNQLNEERYKNQIEVYLRLEAILTRKTKEIKPEEASTIYPQIRELMEGLDEETLKEAKKFIGQVINFSRSPQEQRVAPIYLYGSPGVGKTRFITHLSQIMGLPLINLSFQGKNPYEILGREDIADSYNRFGANDMSSRLGLILDELSLVDGDGPVIIFLDELDRAMLQDPFGRLKKTVRDLFDQDGKEDVSKNAVYLAQDMAVKLKSRVIFVAAGNSNDKRRLNLGQMKVLTFRPLPLEKKIMIAHKEFRKRFKDYNDGLDYDGEDNHHIINEIVLWDKSDGVRNILKVIDMYIESLMAYRKNRDIFKKYQLDAPEFDIKGAYQSVDETSELFKRPGEEEWSLLDKKGGES